MRVVIPLYDRFTTLDAIGPYEVLRFLPNADVVFAATRTGPIRNDHGTVGIVADAALADIDTADVLLVPGGPGSGAVRADEDFLDFVRRIHATTQWTTSVCSGSLVLGAAGLLTGLKATSHWSVIDVLESFGAIYTAQRVVFQNKIVTAAGVSAGIDMALHLAERIAGQTHAEAIQLMIEYDPQPPFHAGSLAKAQQAVRDLITAGHLG
jgi:putative intracellular protease/amidase